MPPVIPFEQSTVFFDGVFSEPRLNHPEGLAIDAQGNVWCGGEEGEIYRIAADGSAIELMASTGGFTLGMAFDQYGRLYTCDLKHAAVFRFNLRPDALGIDSGNSNADVSNRAFRKTGIVRQFRPGITPVC